MRALKHLLRRVVLHSLYRAGLLMKLADRRLGGRAVVLMYHRVLPLERQSDSFSTPAIIVTPRAFDLHMGFLRKHFNVLDLEQFTRCARGEKAWPPRACLVTFDDGWHDNLEFAHPILKRHGINAVLFAAGDYIGSAATFWQERVGRRLFAAWSRRELPATVADRMRAGADPYTISRETARERIWDLISMLKLQRETELPRLLAELGPDDRPAGVGEDRFLGWDELRRMQTEGSFTVASHAMSHIPLTELAAEQVSTELERSRALLAANLDRNPPALAYPNGNHDETVAELARRAGFEVAFTTIAGLVDKGADPLRVKRFNVSERSVPDEVALLGRIAGIG